LEIAKLYAIEAEAKELTPAERAALRRARAGPILDSFKRWLDQTLAQAPPRSGLAKAIGYTLNRWKALLRYLDDGMLNIDNNPVERSIRGAVLGRKNYLFCGSQGGGHRAVLVYSLIESAKLNHLDPYAYFVDILTKLPTCRAKHLPALLTYRWKAGNEAQDGQRLSEQHSVA
jgi:transposase